MKLTKLTAGLVAAGLTSFSSLTLAGVVTTDGQDIVIKTNGGFEAKTADGQFKFKVGGRLQLDYDFYDDAYNGGADDTASDSEIRRARIFVAGTAYEDWHYKLQISYNDGDDDFNLADAYIKYTGWDVAYIKAGKFKIPFGLEELTSSKYISTIERSAVFDVVRSGRSDRSLEVGNHGNGFTWRAGVYETGREDEGGFNDFGIGARLTYAPILEDNQVLHVGAAYFNENIGDSFSNKFASRFGVHTASKGELTTVVTDDQHQAGLEVAYVRGPFSVQGEYIYLEADDDGDSDIEFHSVYVQGTYTLTGEMRPYDKKSGAFKGINPKGEYGAWELVARYEYADMDVDGKVDPGFDVYTLGVNWYANKNVRLSLNYLHTETDDIFGVSEEDDGDAITTRAQFIF